MILLNNLLKEENEKFQIQHIKKIQSVVANFQLPTDAAAFSPTNRFSMKRLYRKGLIISGVPSATI